MRKPVFHDEEYLDLVEYVLYKGHQKNDRTGTGVRSLFGHQMRFDLSGNIIPLLTTKKMHIPSIIHEILWYISGDTNIKYLNDNGVRIWDEWADSNGDLGPIYGHQWRKVPVYEEACGACDAYNVSHQVDQLQQAIDTIRTNPDSRRIIVNSWNVSQLHLMALPPCHAFFQFYVAGNKLSCKLTQRSCDVGLGVPFNIAQYSILTCMVAQITGLEPGEFIWSGGDIHIYDNHVAQLTEQLYRQPYPSPKLKLNLNVEEIDNFKYDDFEIIDYKHHDAIKMEVSV